MFIENNIKIILLVLLLISISIYSLFTELSIIIIKEYSAPKTTLDYSNILMSIKISSAIISVFTILISLKSKYLAKIILGKNYIAGKYKGMSYKINNNNDTVEKNKEIIKIDQNLITTKISGVSYEKDERLGNYNQWNGKNWNGKLISIDNRNFMFLINISTPHSSYLDIMSLNILDKQVKGFISASSSGDLHKWKFKLEKTNEKELKEEGKK